MVLNPGQQKFHDFILERVLEDKKEYANQLLAESFGKQADGTFSPDYLMSFIPKMMAMIKPEFQDEVKTIMTNFRNKEN